MLSFQRRWVVETFYLPLDLPEIITAPLKQAPTPDIAFTIRQTELALNVSN